MRRSDITQRRRFEEETRMLFHQRLFPIILVGMILFPVFSFIDYVVAREYFLVFIFLRGACALGFILLLLISYTRFGKLHPFTLGLIAYLMAGITLSIMVVTTGIHGSIYEIGFIIVLIVFSSLLPLDTKQSTVTGFLLFFIYVISVLVFSRPTAGNVHIFFINAFYLFTFVLICILKCYADHETRSKEFALRMELDSQKEKLQYMAYYDMLTGLPNRTLFYGLYPLTIARGRRNNTLVILMMIDLNHFKEINDTYGHDTGDRVLRHAGELLSKSIRAEDLVVRLGGDEFVIIIQNIQKGEEVAGISKRIVEAFVNQVPIEISGEAYTVSASIGVTVVRPDEDSSADEAKAKADRAMYMAKDQSKAMGHNTCIQLA
ncbi:MAG: GGDEF domain-containing protein [Syntrophaceae bacterium]